MVKRTAIMETREHATWYLKVLKENGKVRNRINEATSRERLLKILNEFVEELQTRMKVSL
ncbi:hypothetical protein GLW08_20885 [Pontibacillus yanchengensis]|nr:hypothetical protein [Pontibacillus yanchengensis]